jgi:hypothetical protein
VVSQAFQPAPDVVARRLGDSAVLIRLTTNRIYELNETGARVWEMLQGGLSVDTTIDTLAREFAAARPVIANEVEQLLQKLSAEGLVVSQ